MASYSQGFHPELRGLSLCAGYGGLDLGVHIAEPGFRSVCYVEREPHAAAALAARMADGCLPEAAVWGDLRTFDGRPWRGRVHLVLAGYPCQPFSVAGDRRGRDDPRHLWPEVARIIREVEPELVFLENVEGHLSLGFAEVAQELQRMGFKVAAGLFTAAEAGASHVRRRLFILAHADRDGRRLFPGPGPGGRAAPDAGPVQHPEGERRPVLPAERGADVDLPMADPEGVRVVGPDDDVPLFTPRPGDFRSWERLLFRRPDLQPAVLRDDDGVADWLDRRRGAGNGVVSLAAALAWRTLGAALDL
ncbi:MAG: DNA cytosine methyltransferase [Phenylobacterium sp.]